MSGANHLSQRILADVRGCGSGRTFLSKLASRNSAREMRWLRLFLSAPTAE